MLRRAITSGIDGVLTVFSLLGMAALGTLLTSQKAPALQSQTALASTIEDFVLHPGTILQTGLRQGAASIPLGVSQWPTWILLAICLCGLIALKVLLVALTPPGWQIVGATLAKHNLWGPARIDTYILLRTGPNGLNRLRRKILLRFLFTCVKMLAIGLVAGLATWAMIVMLNSAASGSTLKSIALSVGVFIIGWLTLAYGGPDLFSYEDRVDAKTVPALAHTAPAVTETSALPPPLLVRPQGEPPERIHLLPYVMLAVVAASACGCYLAAPAFVPGNLRPAWAMVIAQVLWVTLLVYAVGAWQRRDRTLPQRARLKFVRGRRPTVTSHRQLTWIMNASDQFSATLTPLPRQASRLVAHGRLELSSLDTAAVEWTMRAGNELVAQGMLSTDNIPYIDLPPERVRLTTVPTTSGEMQIAFIGFSDVALPVGSPGSASDLTITVRRTDDSAWPAAIGWADPSVLKWLK